MLIVLGNHPVPVKLQRIFFESVRQGFTKRKLADENFGFTVSQTDHSRGFVCLAVIRLEAPELDFFFFDG